MVAPSIKAATNLNASVVNMRFIKPIDVALIEEMAKMHDLIVTIEENSLMGGAGSAVMETMQTLNLSTPTLCLGLPDTFMEHGIHETMLAQCGLDSDGITNSIKNKLSLI
jgi:1-deoxy-D-xylulose-5-phosphate synthase